MKPPSTHLIAAILALGILATSVCANFRRLGQDLAILDNQYRISGVIENADNQRNSVRGAVIEWDHASSMVFSADSLTLGPGGAFAFSVENPNTQYLAAITDADGDGRHSPGDPWWTHNEPSGQSPPVAIKSDARPARLRSSLQTSNPAPARQIRTAIDNALAGRKVSEFVTHQGVCFALGETAMLDNPAGRKRRHRQRRLPIARRGTCRRRQRPVLR